MAREGLAADPIVPPPQALRRYLGFSRLSPGALRAIARVVERDEAFRARVAASVDEDRVGRAGWLWLARPDGWADELSAIDAEATARAEEERRARDERSAVKKLAAAQAAASEAAAVADRRAREADELRAELARQRALQADVAARLVEAESQADRLGAARTDAVRNLKDVEARLVERSTELNAAKARIRELEERSRARDEPVPDGGGHPRARDGRDQTADDARGPEAPGGSAPRGSPVPAVTSDASLGVPPAAPPPAPPPAPPRSVLAQELARAAAGAASLADSLATLARLLEPPGGDAGGPGEAGSRPGPGEVVRAPDDGPGGRTAIDATSTAGPSATVGPSRGEGSPAGAGTAESADPTDTADTPVNAARSAPIDGADMEGTGGAPDGPGPAGTAGAAAGPEAAGAAGVAGGPGAVGTVGTVPSDEPGGPSAPAARVPVRLPGGIFDDSAAAAEHLLRTAGVVLVVDGYNVTMTGWPALNAAEQRRRLVGVLAELAARTATEIEIVFDGADVGSVPVPAPVRSLVHVRFSPPGVEADDVVLDLVASLPPARPVVVASSDNRVRDGARALGANVVHARQLLDALRR